MKLIEFGSRYSFYKWFYKHDRSDNYPLTDLNYRHCWEDDTHIYRCVEKGKDVGVDDKEDVSDAEELTRDLMALLASFSGKYYGRRSLDRRKRKDY